jgi:hypothetical protein
MGRLQIKVRYLFLILLSITVQKIEANPLNQAEAIFNRIENSLGTIECDGAIRGLVSKLLLPNNEQINGSIFVTAAHNLLNKKTDKQFEKCSIRMKNGRFNRIDNAVVRATNDFVFLYSSNEIPSSGIRFTEIEVNPINFFSIGYDAIDEKIIFYTPCKKIYSPVINEDGLLFHNCVSKSGNSGGALLDIESGNLVAIHGGQFLITHTTKNRFLTKKTKKVSHAKMIDRSFITSLETFLFSLMQN